MPTTHRGAGRKSGDPGARERQVAAEAFALACEVVGLWRLSGRVRIVGFHGRRQRHFADSIFGFLSEVLADSCWREEKEPVVAPVVLFGEQ